MRLFCDRLFGDLDKDLLTFAKQVRDRRLRRSTAPVVTVKTFIVAALTIISRAIAAVVTRAVIRRTVVSLAVASWTIFARTVADWPIIPASPAAFVAGIAAFARLAVIATAWPVFRRLFTIIRHVSLRFRFAVIGYDLNWNFNDLDDLVAAISLILESLLILRAFITALVRFSFTGTTASAPTASNGHFGVAIGFLMASFGIIEPFCRTLFCFGRF